MEDEIGSTTPPWVHQLEAFKQLVFILACSLLSFLLILVPYLLEIHAELHQVKEQEAKAKSYYNVCLSSVIPVGY